MSVKVSIIIPVYNVEQFLPKCLSSVINQSYRDFEVICINDGSTDNSLQILNRYSQLDSRIKIYSQSNQGVSAARNIGIMKAEGEFIEFLDGDDEISPKFLEIMCSFLIKNDDVDFVLCNYMQGKELKEWNNKIQTISFISQPFDHFYMRRKPKLNEVIWNKIYRKKILLGLEFNEHLSFGEDIVFLNSVLHRSQKAIYIHAELYFYRQRIGSAMSEGVSYKRLENEILVADTLISLFKDKPMSSSVRKRFNGYIAKRFLYCVTKKLKNYKKDNQNEILIFFLKKLIFLEKNKIFNPKDLSLKNRFRYWLIKHRNTCKHAKD